MTPLEVRYLVGDTIDQFTGAYMDRHFRAWSPYDPDAVKELSRDIRDALVGAGLIVADVP